MNPLPHLLRAVRARRCDGVGAVHARRRGVVCSARPPRRSAGGAALAALVALACATPAPALAAGEPTILTAGIDDADHFFVTWRLEPDTTFDFLEFASVAIANPFTRGTFAGKNIIASECALPAQGCTAPPPLTFYRSPDPVSRDRRYFVKVNSRKGDRSALSSQVWVIDKEKPLLPGGGRPATTATNKPSLGEPYKPPANRTIPTPRLVIESAPKRIAAVIRDGVRASVICPAFSCYAVIGLQLGRTTLVFSDVTARPGERETFRLRPVPARRAALQRRTRARLEVRAELHYPGGKRTTLVRRFTVRR